MPLAVGTIIAGYRIEGVLGAGGMGTVYLARHPTLPRSDALKILSAELSLDRQFRTRFTREADLAATLSHPNIVRVYNRGATDDGLLWIAMEYVDGTAVSDLSRSDLTPARIARVIGDVATALDYAHSRRVLHRDIKPANFLVSAPGTDHERVLLADFGIARAADDATALTGTGLLVGTAAYAAPEAIEGGRPVDHRADIYSLGCTLFRLLTGRTPYDDGSGSLRVIATGHLMRPIPRPSELTPGLPAALDHVISRALAKDPNDRFQSAAALAAATAAALANTAAIPPSTAGPETKNWAPPALSYPTTPPPAPPTSGLPGPGGPGLSHPPPPHYMGGPQFSGPPGGFPAPLHALQHPPRRRRRRAIITSGIALAVVAAIATTMAILFTHNSDGGANDLAPYQPQSLTGMFGTVKLDKRPTAIAALGPGDPDAVLSLGVQPVAIGGLQGQLPSWLQTMVHSSATVMPTADPAAVAATKPDLIINTGPIDKPTYDKLNAIAPTLTRPANSNSDLVWQQQLPWIATALGRSDTAKKLLDDAASQQSAIKSQHPRFNGKSIAVVNYSDAGTTVATPTSAPTNYLEGLGFRYDPDAKRASPNDPPDKPLDVKQDFYQLVTADVMIVLRTDSAAGGGGFAGLPAPFNGYGGTLVIVDDPDTITALNTGGPAATTYLNNTLVNKLANQVH